MSTVSPARLRAIGLLLIEAGLLGLVVWQRVGKDPAVSSRLAGLVAKVRAL
jgi:hypothetical protein